MSIEYFARPDTFCGPSILEMRLPMKVRLSASGHLYSAIALPSLLPSLRRLRDRCSNAHIGTAPAGIAAEPFLNLIGGWIRILVQKRLACDHEAGSAEATLLGVIVDEGLLNRVQIVALHQAFYGGN